MKDAFIQLLKVKSIVTIVATGVFAFLSIAGKISAEQFMQVFTVIIAFYFGTQHEKKSEGQTTIISNYAEPQEQAENENIDI